MSLVTFLCKQIDPTEVFQPAEQVAQSIILSLIQQLSINLTEETDLKTKYVFIYKSIIVFPRFAWNISSEVAVSCQIVNCFQPFTIFALMSNFHVWKVSEYASGIDIFYQKLRMSHSQEEQVLIKSSQVNDPLYFAVFSC